MDHCCFCSRGATKRTGLGRQGFVAATIAGLIVAALTPALPGAAIDELPADVAKIFAEHCGRCHGESRRKANLDLSTLATIRRGAESGAVIEAGQADSSRLVEVVVAEEMPPPDEGQPLSADQVAIIRDWVNRLVPEVHAESSLNQHHVLPILLAKCAECHGRQLQEGGLDVRHRSSLFAGGKSGAAIVPGAPAQSLLIQRVRKGEMPPREKLAKYSVKPVSDAELRRLEEWIEAGAPWVDVPPDEPSTAGDPLVSQEDRQHWAFQSPVLPTPPAPLTSRKPANEIDTFVQQRQASLGLRGSRAADRLTLLRRLTFDLTGLPPTPEEIHAYLASRDPDTYERNVDRLLSSPAYAERWGQYWLDLAGYADSEGVQHADPVRPQAYRYRDYVIRSLNADKPYDRFLLEQIAGDELADYEHAEQITEEIYDNLVATGFLRMSSDGTFAGITGFLPNRLDVIDDQIRILSSAVMGLTMRCARCHSHKFDPIPQRDYYRLAAIFKGAMDEFDWLRPLPGSAGKTRYLPYVTTQERRAWEQHEQHLRSLLEPLEAEQQRLEKRSEDADSAAAATARERLKELEQRIGELNAQRRPEPMIRALWDNGDPSPTYLLVRGDYQQPSRVVGPGVPAVLTDGVAPFAAARPWPGARKTGNRLALARWLVSDHHPLTARVLVNRVWKHHFGRGLVETLDDFGLAGARPSHPELLDWLAIRFIEHEYSLKWLHRLIVTSATYRQSSQMDADQYERDPDNRWLTRMPLRRMEAEVLRDSLIAISGRLNTAQFGPADDVATRDDGLVTSRSYQGAWRRSIYIQKRRTQRLTILDDFDRPRMSPNCVDRPVSNVAPQALHLMNNQMIHELSQSLAARVRHDVGDDRRQQIDYLYCLALGRPPNPEEREVLLKTLHQLAQLEERGDPESLSALTNVCHAVMNSAAFLYID